MKRFRLLILVAGALVVLLVVAIAVALNSSFQTWMTRKAIASQPGVRATVGSVTAGMKRVELRDLRFEQGSAVLTLPLVEVDVPLLSAAWGKKVFVSRLVAKGWTLDLTKTAGVATVVPGVAPPPSLAPPRQAGTPPLRETATTAANAFAGIFAQLELPLDVSLDGVQLEGDVLLPESRGRVKITLHGGGLGAGREGKFDLAASAALTDANVNVVEVRGGLLAGMGTPRSFTRITAQLDASASGARFPKGVKLHADVAAAHAATGETYSAALVAEGQEILNVKAELPRNAQRLDGTWKIDVRDADVSPFALGQPLPAFTAVGEGKFDADAGFAAIHILGRLNAAVDRLQVIRPELAAVGELKIVATFDLGGRDGALIVQKIEAAINAEKPVASVRTLQPFEFNPSTGELRTADTSMELLGIALQGVPVDWAKPFLKDVEFAGGHVRGEFAATARGGGMTLRSTSPLTIDGLAVTQAGKPLIQRVDLAWSTSADYTPQGWQAEINGLTAKSGEATLLSLDVKAGQLAGSGQPIKATGKLAASLPAMLAQPATTGSVVLASGDAAVDFVVSVNEKKEIQATVMLKNLATLVETNAVKLPALSMNLRADISADGKIAFNAPLVLERDERKSNLTVIGTISPEKDRMRAIDAEVTSTQLVLDDAQVLAAIVPDKTDKTATTTRDTAPPWAGLHGSLALQLKQVIYSDTFHLNNVTGRLRIDAGMVKLEGLQAGLGDSGRANLSGTVTFDASVPQPYTLAADVAVKGFDPSPLFRTMGENHPATVEGKFDMVSTLTGRAATLGDLASGAGGSFQLTSKGGLFRGLPVNVGNIVEHTSRLAAWIASAGTAISAMTGKKEYTDVANKAEAVAELSRGLNPIPYDQLSVVVSRDAALNTTLKDFTLISPEVRLTGGGTALHKPGSTLMEDSLAMEFTLRARGRQGELLKYLGALDQQTDDLGYATCTVPLRVGGTLGRPDTSELNGKLTSLALEKSGLGEKAVEFLSKIRGGK